MAPSLTASATFREIRGALNVMVSVSIRYHNVSRIENPAMASCPTAPYVTFHRFKKTHMNKMMVKDRENRSAGYARPLSISVLKMAQYLGKVRWNIMKDRKIDFRLVHKTVFD